MNNETQENSNGDNWLISIGLIHSIWSLLKDYKTNWSFFIPIAWVLIFDTHLMRSGDNTRPQPETNYFRVPSFLTRALPRIVSQQVGRLKSADSNDCPLGRSPASVATG